MREDDQAVTAPTTPTSDQGSPSSSSGHDDRWRALAVCLVAGGMCLLDVSIVNVALPSIREGLDASDSQVQWVVAGYSLAFGMALVPAGRLGDARQVCQGCQRMACPGHASTR